eukprot:GGOE01065070.1.p1 GENE.GGOE01065070.1~~GGOE01065070.1.p1  ORF type:complete len:154 (+),score=37.09 GGOE01065070.1:40-501(+)
MLRLRPRVGGWERRGVRSISFYQDSLLGRMVKLFAPPKLESSAERLLKPQTMSPAQRTFRRRLLHLSLIAAFTASIGVSTWNVSAMARVLRQNGDLYEQSTCTRIQQQKEEAAAVVRQRIAAVDQQWSTSAAQWKALGQVVHDTLRMRRFQQA